MPYSYVTLFQAAQAISLRLYDPDFVFWTYDEIVLYIVEALQTWNSYAQYWRGDFVFDTQSDAIGYGDGGFGDGGYGGSSSVIASTWYDITQVPNSLRPYTKTDFNLYTIIEYHLLEPPTGPVWTGTDMFTINDLTQSLQRRWDEMLGVSGCTITQSIQAAPAVTTRNILNDLTIDVRRVAWFPTPASDSDPAAPSVMWQEDIWSQQAFEDGYTTYPQGTPFTYAISSTPQLTFDTDVVPQQPGNYEVLKVNASGYTFNVSTPTVINIPTDFCWILKWGVLADLFSKESEAKDVMRANYCNQRYKQGLRLLQESPAILQLRLNNLALWVDSVKNADEFSTDWQALPQSTPMNAYVAGLNMVAFSPEPEDGVTYSATATVLQNAPIPSLPGDFIQVGRDEYDVIVDYAQHLALLKNGGDEFLRTKDLYARFVRQAALSNSKLTEMGEFKQEIYGTSQREEVSNPRYTKSIANAGSEDDNG